MDIEKGFQFESEVLLNIDKSVKISHIPINTIYNKSKGHMNICSDTHKFIKYVTKPKVY